MLKYYKNPVKKCHTSIRFGVQRNIVPSKESNNDVIVAN